MDIQRIAIVGTGVIGASWTAFYLTQGFDVVATDPAPQADVRLRDALAAFLGERAAELAARLSFDADLVRALDGVDFVQESGPERLDLKRALYRQMDDVLPAHVPIASSSSA